MTAAPADLAAEHPLMRRNLRLMPWWWVLRWGWLGEGIWVIYLIEERGITLGQVLLFEAVFSATVIASELPTGMLADRFGRRLSLILGTVAAVVAFFAFGAGTSVIVLMASYALFGLAETGFSGADTAMLYDSLKATGQDEKFTKWHGRLNAVIALALGGFTAIGSVMTLWVPLWVPIVASAALTLPAVALAWAFTEPPRSDERHTYLRTGVEAVKVVVRTRALITAVGLMTVTTASIWLMGTMQQQYLVNAGMPVWSIGIFVAGQMGMAALGSWIADPLGRRLTLRHTFWLMPVVSALALLVIGSGSVWLYGVFILPALGWNVLFPHFTDYLSRRVTDSLRATAMSVASVITALVSIMIVPVAALGIDHLGLVPTLTVASLVLAAAAALLYLAWVRADDMGQPRIDAPPPLVLP